MSKFSVEIRRNECIRRKESYEVEAETEEEAVCKAWDMWDAHTAFDYDTGLMDVDLCDVVRLESEEGS